MKRLIAAFFHSLHGLVAAWKDEAAFREEIIAFIILAPLSVYLAPDVLSLILMIGSLVLVIIFELVNTAVEAAVNFTGTHRHPQAKKAKDVASAAILVALINAVFVWAVILL